ncbi:hypothetical protein BS78_06G026300 [Paspalum vaginatum]|nr:hypothetical protein BS78_06G026300 [Paspalum vaginatum]
MAPKKGNESHARTQPNMERMPKCLPKREEKKHNPAEEAVGGSSTMQDVAESGDLDMMPTAPEIIPTIIPTRESIFENSPRRVTRSRLAMLLGEGTQRDKTPPKKLTPRKLRIN